LEPVVQSSIPDITEADLQRIVQLRLRRYGRSVPVESAESGVSVGGDAMAITMCPTLYWTERVLIRLLAREPIRRQDYAFMWRAKQLAVTE
jgi:hypothetical protein